MLHWFLKGTYLLTYLYGNIPSRGRALSNKARNGSFHLHCYIIAKQFLHTTNFQITAYLNCKLFDPEPRHADAVVNFLWFWGTTLTYKFIYVLTCILRAFEMMLSLKWEFFFSPFRIFITIKIFWLFIVVSSLLGRTLWSTDFLHIIF